MLPKRTAAPVTKLWLGVCAVALFLRKVGMVWVNTWLHRDLRTAFGGVKESGLGREVPGAASVVVEKH